jgi:hypothetical protein
VPVSTLGINDDWVTLSSERILWLPPEYRPGTWASYGDTIIIGSGTGRYSLRYDALFVIIAAAFRREEVIRNKYPATKPQKSPESQSFS